MKFIKAPLKDAYVVETEPRTDERGFFARASANGSLRVRG